MDRRRASPWSARSRSRASVSALARSKASLARAAAWASYGLLSGHFGNTLSVAGAILVGCVVYVILVVALRVVSKDDLSLMPKGEKIAKLLRIR